MGRSASKEQSSDDDQKREALRAALMSAREDHEKFERLRTALQLRAALAQINQSQSISSTSSAQTSSQQITIRTSGDQDDLVRALALHAVISQANDDNSESASGTEVDHETADEENDSDEEQSAKAINALLALGEVASMVAQMKHGENAETIADVPPLGCRVGKRNEDEGNSNEIEAGTVVEVCFKLTFDVLWDKGEKETFLVGCKDRTVVVLDTAPTGVKHRYIRCDTCPTSAPHIEGTRWRCMECYDFDLCTSCYMNNKHNTGHIFIRFDKENFNGYCVPPRSSSNEVVQSVGLFPGATVQRGPDWKWGDQDGGTGKSGNISQFENFSTEHPRSGVRVRWSSGGNNCYRVGFNGKVDLKCVTAAKGLTYYWNHLLKCSVEPNESKPVFDYHQRVKCTLPMDLLEPLMQGHEGWDANIAEYIGKNGIVVGFMANNDVVVQYHPLSAGGSSAGRRHVWIFHPASLEKSANTTSSQQTTAAVPVQATTSSSAPSTAQGSRPTISSVPSTSAAQKKAEAPSGPPSMCQSCDEEYASVTFHPCGHNLVCEGCSVRMKKCMSCRANIDSKTHVVIRKPAATRQQASDAAGVRQCEICMDEVKDTAFVPCGHGACSECSKQVDQCHICRVKIVNKIRTYF